MEFVFLEVTNLKKPSDAHMIRMRFKLGDARPFTKDVVYLENGAEEVTTLFLEREE